MKIKVLDDRPPYASIDGGCVCCVGTMAGYEVRQTFAIQDDNAHSIRFVTVFQQQISILEAMGVVVGKWRREG